MVGRVLGSVGTVVRTRSAVRILLYNYFAKYNFGALPILLEILTVTVPNAKVGETPNYKAFLKTKSLEQLEDPAHFVEPLAPPS